MATRVMQKARSATLLVIGATPRTRWPPCGSPRAPSRSRRPIAATTAGGRLPGRPGMPRPRKGHVNEPEQQRRAEHRDRRSGAREPAVCRSAEEGLLGDRGQDRKGERCGAQRSCHGSSPSEDGQADTRQADDRHERGPEASRVSRHRHQERGHQDRHEEDREQRHARGVGRLEDRSRSSSMPIPARTGNARRMSGRVSVRVATTLTAAPRTRPRRSPGIERRVIHATASTFSRCCPGVRFESNASCPPSSRSADRPR